MDPITSLILYKKAHTGTKVALIVISILQLQKQIRKTGQLMMYTASIKNRCISVALQTKNVLLIGDKLHIPNKSKCDIIIF